MHINLHLDHLDNLRRINMNGAVAELADAGDLKSPGLYPCGFDPHPPYLIYGGSHGEHPHIRRR